MNPHNHTNNLLPKLPDALSLIIEKRFLPIEDGPWIVEGVCVSAREVSNAKGQPPATTSVEIEIESEDGWKVVLRAAVGQGKLWQPARWLRLHDYADAELEGQAAHLARFAEWVESL